MKLNRHIYSYFLRGAPAGKLVSAFCIAIFMFSTHQSAARLRGQMRIDSMLRELGSAKYQGKEDTNKVKLLNELSKNYNSIDPAEGIRQGLQALALAEKLKWPAGIASSWRFLALNYLEQSDNKNALEGNFKALKIYEDEGIKEGIAAVYNNIGLVYQRESNYPKTLEYYFKALQINEEIQSKQNRAANISNIGEVYAAQQNYAKALDYDIKAKNLFEELDNKEGVANQLGNMGLVYAAQNDDASALQYYFKGLKIFEDAGNKNHIAFLKGCIADIYLQQGKYTDAKQYLFDALKVYEETGSKDGVGITLGGIGQYYVGIARDSSGTVYPADNGKRHLQNAIEYLDKSIAICKEVTDLEHLRKFSRVISDAYLLSGNYKEAMDSYKQYDKINDSIFSTSNKLKISNLESAIEIDVKDKQLAIEKLEVTSEKRNVQTFFISGIALLLLVIIIGVRNYSFLKTSNKLLETSHNLLTAEKERSEKLLLNILPAEVADELKHKGSAVAKSFDNVTVVFTGFTGFTKAGERMDPQQLVSELDTCFKAFDEIFTRYKIEKIKTVGDAYLAVAGLPVADPRHAENIVNAAREISHFMAERKKQLGDRTFDMRIGVHSGSVIAGIVGVKKFAYDIWGDTVNTAARMEENSEGGKINISEVTYELVKDKFACVYRGEINAKNKGAMRMYFVE